MRLAAVERVLKEKEVALNDEKCIYSVSELQFLGHRLSADGIAPSTDKLEAIQNFREPITAEEFPRAGQLCGEIHSRAY